MNLAKRPEPVTLEGTIVRLEPLSVDHSEALLTAAKDPSIWTYLTVPQPQSAAEMRRWIESALSEQEKGTHLAFAAISRESDAVVGTTRYLDIRPFDGSLEIGWTWYAAEAQRTGVNTECKYLLMRHAFEALGFTRVQLKTDAKNERSRRAIERIGGRFEGVLRHYQRYWHGALRDTAMYGITAEDWPEVKSHFETRLLQRALVP